jgi:hypothetical protein
MTSVNAMNAKTLVLKSLKKEVEELRDSVSKEEETKKFNWCFDSVIRLIKEYEKA